MLQAKLASSVSQEVNDTHFLQIMYQKVWIWIEDYLKSLEGKASSSCLFIVLFSLLLWNQQSLHPIWGRAEHTWGWQAQDMDGFIPP